MAGQNYRKRGGLITIFMMVIWMLAISKFIPLSRIVFPQGIAVFFAGYQLFLMVFLLSGYMVSAFVSKWIALRLSRGQYKNAKRVFTTTLLVSLVFNLVLGLLFFLGADFYAGVFVHIPYGVYAMKCLAVLFPLYGAVGVFCGYFQGMGTMMPTCVAGLLGQVVTVPLSLIFGRLFCQYGAKVAAFLQQGNYQYSYCAIAIVLSMIAGALVSLLFLVFVYFVYQGSFRKNVLADTTKTLDSQRDLVGQFFSYILPNALPSLLLFLGIWINQKLYFSHIFSTGSLENALIEYGVFYGKYYVVIFIPVLFLVAACRFLIPVVEKLRAREAYHQLRLEFEEGVKQILLFGGIVSLALTILSGVFGGLLCRENGELLTKQFLFGGFGVLFYALAIYTTAFVKGLDVPWLSVSLWVICLVVQSILVYVLITVAGLGILAVVIGFWVYPLLLSAVNYLLVRKELY